MTVLRSSAFNMVAVLGGFTLLSGALLGGVYLLTEKPIAEARHNTELMAVEQVLPGISGESPADAVDVVPDGSARPVSIYPVFDTSGQILGAAVKSYSLDGFSGEIEVMFGFDSSGRVTGYSVLSHGETPGLGAKMESWFAGSGSHSVIGIDPGSDKAVLTKDGGDIDGITAATITSRALIDAMHRAHAAYLQYLDTQK
ncbi:MAG: RnfABCDGE type electron transport complex subunit G [Muribaculaceae bacterium]|nr:RnfABCDGE type electron transport complex subunit G [Muribaculaceae bacterium]